MNKAISRLGTDKSGDIFMRKVKKAVTNGIAATLICLSVPALSDQTVGEHVTIDGLVQIEDTRLDRAYVRPGMDLSAYDKVRLAPVSISYDKDSFELSDKQVKRMKQTFSDELAKGLKKSGYTLVKESGEDVLLLVAEIADLDVKVPTRQFAGRGAVFTATSGSMVLIGELRDSRSGQVLARFADYQKPRSQWEKATSVGTWQDVRTAFRFWASILRDRLDHFHQEQG